MSATLKLWELGGQLEAIADALIENGGELTAELVDQLATLGGAFEWKTERILLYARNLQAQADVAKQEAARLATLAGGRERAAERLKVYVLESMERAGLTKIETALVKARIQDNSRPTIQWFGPADAIPEPFKRVTVGLDGEKAYEIWKATRELPVGFLVERGRHLRVQ